MFDQIVPINRLRMNEEASNRMDLTPIMTAVRQAVQLCVEVQTNSLRSTNKFSADKKEKEPVTIADYGSQAIICRMLREHFPHDAVISEEAGVQFLELTDDSTRAEISNLLTTILDVNVTQDDIVSWLDFGTGIEAQRTWVIDPIDGTKGFINRRHYAIAVGIVEAGQPVGGILAAPGYGDPLGEAVEGGVIFYVEDGGAYRVPILGGDAQPIHVSQRTAGLRVVQSFEKQHASKSRMQMLREHANIADASVYELDSMEKYALVASGDADVYMRLPVKGNNRPHLSWDHAAGTAIVLAAGGRVTDVDGSPLDFSQGKILPNQGMLVSNGTIHDRLVEAAQTVLAEDA